MSVDANALERETLERKDRDELQKIAGALGGKVTSRTRKADIIDMILDLTGVTARSEGGDAASTEESVDDAGSEPSKADTQNGKADTQNGKADAKAGDAESDAADGDGADGAGSKSEKGADKGGDDKADSSAGQKAGQKSEQKSGQQGQQSGQNQGGQNNDDGEGGGKRRRRRGRNRDANTNQDEFTGEPIPVSGLLDLRDDGYGFLRVESLLPSKDDCYVSVKQVRQFGLRKGDLVAGGSRPAFRNEKNPAMLRIDSVNDAPAEADNERPVFEELTPVFPDEHLALTLADESDARIARAIDLLAPIGKGSRVLLAAPPRTGKTTVLEAIARSVETNEPDVALLVVLLDERPEEIAEMERYVAGGRVFGSAFDADPQEHLAILDLAVARARRLAENGDDVVLLVDGLTRLARAEHATGQGTNRTFGGLDTNAVSAAKRVFGTGRKLTDAGSVTIVATAAVDTDSGIDAAVYEAVAPVATTEIRLDADAAARRVFPAIDPSRSGTRHEEMLVGDDGAEAREVLRRSLAGLPDGDSPDHADGLDQFARLLRETQTNDELLETVAKDAG